MNHPDPKLHRLFSFVKSSVRIMGYLVLPWSMAIGATVLVISEIIGIWEETV